jgi:predicted phage terminase large subunit-like protein
MSRAPVNQAAVLDAALRKHPLLFLQKAFQEVCPRTEFVPGWHLEAMIYQLCRAFSGEAQRSLITIAPRSLKSISLIAMIAFELGKDPTRRFICVSYNNELAAKLARDRRQVVESAWYRRLFPKTRLRRSTEMELETTLGGGCFATSVGGTLTGLGADVIIIDDPMKADDAHSAAARQQVLHWTTSTLFSRLNDKRTGAIVVMQQRLHDGDLVGHFLEQGEWEHLNLPAIAEERQEIPLGENRLHVRQPGDVLQPEREPREVLERLRKEIGSYAFSAQYQQAPVPAGGTLVQREWLRRYDRCPERQRGDEVIQSWDTASKQGPLSDYSVCITALKRNKTVYVLDVFPRKLDFPDLVRTVQMLAEHWEPDVLLIEDAASGQQLIQTLEAESLPHVPIPIPCKPDSDKITRLSGCTSLIEAGGLALPHEAPWLADFERELLAFPNGRFDDQVDALSQLLSWARNQPKIINAMAVLMPTESYWFRSD